MTTIYLIRHAQAEEKKDTQRAKLTASGIKQAETLAKRLKDTQIDVFYASSYQRGKRTAEIVSKFHEENILESRETLSEVYFKVKKRVSLGVFKELKNFYTQNEVEQIKNLLQAQKRAMRFIDHLFKKYPGKNIAVVTHGNIIKAIILGILDLELSSFFRFNIFEASITIIQGTDRDNAKIISVNDTYHLKNL